MVECLQQWLLFAKFCFRNTMQSWSESCTACQASLSFKQVCCLNHAEHNYFSLTSVTIVPNTHYWSAYWSHRQPLDWIREAVIKTYGTCLDKKPHSCANPLSMVLVSQTAKCWSSRIAFTVVSILDAWTIAFSVFSSWRIFQAPGKGAFWIAHHHRSVAHLFLSRSSREVNNL